MVLRKIAKRYAVPIFKQKFRMVNVNYKDLPKQNLQMDEKIQIAHCEYPVTTQETRKNKQKDITLLRSHK